MRLRVMVRKSRWCQLVVLIFIYSVLFIDVSEAADEQSQSVKMSRVAALGLRIGRPDYIAKEIKRNKETKDISSAYFWSLISLREGDLGDITRITDLEAEIAEKADILAIQRAASDYQFVEYKPLLLNAIETGDYEALKILVSCKESSLMDIDEAACRDYLRSPDYSGRTLLHQAVMARNTESVRVLLATQLWDIDTQTKEGMTPVIAAVYQNQTEILDMLLESNVQNSSTKALYYPYYPLFTENVKGVSGYQLAIKSGRYDIVEKYALVAKDFYRFIQENLKKRKLYEGVVDGVPGAVTYNAIALFKNKLDPKWQWQKNRRFIDKYLIYSLRYESDWTAIYTYNIGNNIYCGRAQGRREEVEQKWKEQCKSMVIKGKSARNCKLQKLHTDACTICFPDVLDRYTTANSVDVLVNMSKIEMAKQVKRLSAQGKSTSYYDNLYENIKARVSSQSNCRYLRPGG
ncbi:MAG: ankyrin repeat domain-containing protein [Pseudomonadales bacterium]|nr:ankyrin repeat domain-containing protein [Pseudomonadales bacterium]